MCTTELKKSVGCPRETRIIHDSSKQDHITEALQYYNSLYTNYIRVKVRKSYIL
jgi:hypothetical protein